MKLKFSIVIDVVDADNLETSSNVLMHMSALKFALRTHLDPETYGDDDIVCKDAGLPITMIGFGEPELEIVP